MKFHSKFILVTLIVFVVFIMTTACESISEEFNTKEQDNDDIQENNPSVTGTDKEVSVGDVKSNGEIHPVIIDIANTDAYTYPVRPGTPEWKKLSSNSMMVEACQVPESILKEMSTEGLVITVLNYPLYPDVFAFNTPQGGFEMVARQFNGLEELLERDDAGIELLDRYKTMNPLTAKEDWIGADSIYYTWMFFNIEILLCQDDILEDFDKSQLTTLIKEAKKKYNAKVQSQIGYPRHTARVIGKALQQAEFEPFVNKVLQNENLNKFLSDGFAYDDSIANEILSSMEQFSTKQ